MYTYNAELLRIIDGDTVVVKVDLGFHLYRDIKLRLDEIDAPEMKTPEGKVTKQALTDFLADGKIVVQTEKDPGSYDRYTAKVYKDAQVVVTINGTYVNKWELDNDLAKPYHYRWMIHE